MPKINWVIKQRKLQLAGHCMQVHNLILWKTKNGMLYNIRNRETTHNIYIHHKETLGLLRRQITNTDDGLRKMENNNMIWSRENSVIIIPIGINK